MATSHICKKIDSFFGLLLLRLLTLRMGADIFKFCFIEYCHSNVHVERQADKYGVRMAMEEISIAMKKSLSKATHYMQEMRDTFLCSRTSDSHDQRHYVFGLSGPFL